MRAALIAAVCLISITAAPPVPPVRVLRTGPTTFRVGWTQTRLASEVCAFNLQLWTPTVGTAAVWSKTFKEADLTLVSQTSAVTSKGTVVTLEWATPDLTIPASGPYEVRVRAVVAGVNSTWTVLAFTWDAGGTTLLRAPGKPIAVR